MHQCLSAVDRPGRSRIVSRCVVVPLQTGRHCAQMDEPGTHQTGSRWSTGADRSGPGPEGHILPTVPGHGWPLEACYRRPQQADCTTSRTERQVGGPRLSVVHPAPPDGGERPIPRNPNRVQPTTKGPTTPPVGRDLLSVLEYRQYRALAFEHIIARSPPLATKKSPITQPGIAPLRLRSLATTPASS